MLNQTALLNTLTLEPWVYKTLARPETVQLQVLTCPKWASTPQFEIQANLEIFTGNCYCRAEL